MKLKVKDEHYNPLFKRKELYVEAESDSGTTTREDLKNSIASKYGIKAENVYVMNIASSTGRKEAFCQVQIYDDTETAKTIVPEHIRVRNLNPDERKKVREQRAKAEKEPAK